MKRKNDTQKRFSFAKAWAPELESSNFVQVSGFFLENYAKLEPHPLSHAQAMFVIHLMQFKWDEKHPYPSYETIANRMGVSDKQARRYAAELEDNGYLKRIKRVSKTNKFNLNNLIKALVTLKLAHDAKKKKRTVKAEAVL